jgi:NAD(P)-dependent dehydrogenase (short-subunit alcohol dehydrogenase family)
MTQAPARDLAGRRAVVTGGARGLGRAIAERLAAAGANVTVIDRPGEIAGLPPGWEGEAVDVGAPDAKAAMRRLAGRLGPVDVVVANAGLVPPWRRMADLDPEEWRRVMDVNAWGVAATIGAFAPALARTGRGSVVALASINGTRAHPLQALYTASKHAVVGIVRAAALDLGPEGTRVNALAPGPVATDALLGRIAARHEAGGPAPEAALAAMGAGTALGRLARAAEVAAAAHFLASDAAAGITGAVLPVEAGLA